MLSGDERGRDDLVLMEYTGEGTYAPCMMLRKDGFKYIHCRTDPPMLFNLDKDRRAGQFGGRSGPCRNRGGDAESYRGALGL